MDCDNYALALMGKVKSTEGWSGLPFGTILGKRYNSRHAINCFIDINESIWLVEPQNDSISQDYDVWNVLLILV